ncbi:MAG TPA: hypothetical protein DCZ94_08845 [Lentisphaeria bacterium]|nr:MAG: hypothetical protein A2X48_23555 [Lentisphaerae bacterium GWF2_49_21]HBC87047.1 hypothetical protein [Lentisphaeria bacterium]
MKRRMHLHFLKRKLQHDVDDLKEVVEMSELHLQKDIRSLSIHVEKELADLSEEEKEYTAGWYAEDFFRLDKVLPGIQRRAFFLTAMSMLEANLIYSCKMCHRAYGFEKEFKKKRDIRTIIQALDYLNNNLSIRQHSYKYYWDILQHLWTIRNCLVHSDGKPSSKDEKEITDFCKEFSSIKVDRLKGIVFKKGSMEKVIHIIDQLFRRLMDEIGRNKMPEK